MQSLLGVKEPEQKIQYSVRHQSPLPTLGAKQGVKAITVEPKEEMESGSVDTRMRDAGSSSVPASMHMASYSADGSFYRFTRVDPMLQGIMVPAESNISKTTEIVNVLKGNAGGEAGIFGAILRDMTDNPGGIIDYASGFDSNQRFDLMYSILLAREQSEPKAVVVTVKNTPKMVAINEVTGIEMTAMIEDMKHGDGDSIIEKPIVWPVHSFACVQLILALGLLEHNFLPSAFIHAVFTEIQQAYATNLQTASNTLRIPIPVEFVRDAIVNDLTVSLNHVSSNIVMARTKEEATSLVKNAIIEGLTLTDVWRAKSEISREMHIARLRAEMSRLKRTEGLLAVKTRQNKDLISRLDEFNLFDK